jgi:tetratricopeptide (TPR) repeat protein
MRATITLLFMALLLGSCNSVKRNQKFLAQGDYDQVIELAVRKLQKDPHGKNSGAHASFLEEAFARVVEEAKRRLNFLKQENHPSNTREIYYLYCDLGKRQELIRPLTSMVNLNLQFEDYSKQIIASKKNFADYLFAEGTQYLNRNTILDAREAYAYYSDLKSLQPDYLGLDQKLNDAHFKGTDFVFVELNNHSGQIIPFRLEQELLDFNTYGLDDFWTEYHTRSENGIQYNFGIDLNFKEINVSPERVSEKEFLRKKTIKDGWEYVLDRYGNVMKDSLGNDIKVDKFITVTAAVTYTEQTKAVQVGGDVVYLELDRNRIINRHPLGTEFIFENIFARFRGDERALTEEDLQFIKYDFFPFPSNQQMVLDAGQEIKERLKEILQNNKFR